LELLRHVRQHGAGSVRELSMALKRDYKNVHQDVAMLEAAGLLQRDGRKLTAPWDELQASVSLMTS
jgi:predicted transcriptional regulator